VFDITLQGEPRFFAGLFFEGKFVFHQPRTARTAARTARTARTAAKMGPAAKNGARVNIRLNYPFKQAPISSAAQAAGRVPDD
jgi:hypothetical protein